jgi:hypothetical protein
LHPAHQLDLCCDNCIRKKNRTRHFKSIYDLVGLLDASYGREPISYPANDDDSDLESTTSPKNWGNLRAGNRLTARRRVLEDWRYNCWKRVYQLCSWGVTGVMPDLVVSKLASSIKIVSTEDLLEAIPDWDYARKYGDEVLLLLKGADHEQQLESQAQRTKTRQENKKRKLEDLERDEEQQNLRGYLDSGPSATPLTLVRTRIINSVIVKHIPCPAGPQPSRPRPKPVLISRPYTRTDVFDSLMNNPWSA